MVFREYGEDVRFQYLCGLERILVSYRTEEQAAVAIEKLQGAEFQGSSIRVCPVKVSIHYITSRAFVTTVRHHNPAAASDHWFIKVGSS